MHHLKKAFRLSIPVLGAYWFLGITYGLLAANMGYGIWIPILMAAVIYSGSVEFLALTMLAGTFHPVGAAVMALTVGARHLFYGISMLAKYRGARWKKPFLIFWLTDETFAVNYNNQTSHTQQFLVSLLDYIYWISGGVMGYLLGSAMGDRLMSHLKGLDFVVTAMFVAIFMDDYIRAKDTRSGSRLGLATAALCLSVFGPDKFVIPTMSFILIILYLKYRRTKA
ncbi:MAG TPA: branched-chain amino acid ABC transporter permease [Prevotellaceae bacterium]|nr:branched-chain amino acid ABC transporter permease [Prevotellaceae bacterium]